MSTGAETFEGIYNFKGKWGNLGDAGRSKPYEKPIHSNYLHDFWSAGGGGATGEISRNEEMSSRAETFEGIYIFTGRTREI